MSMPTRWDKAVIIGVGLLGGSVGMALRARGIADRVVGIGRDVARLGRGVELGAIDEVSERLPRAFADAGLVVVCTPVDRVVSEVCFAARHLPEGALIVDVGSTKGRIVAGAHGDASAATRFVGAHPLAGSERSGVEHARADLFQGCVCVLTPIAQTDRDRLSEARGLWEALGSRVALMDPAEHDAALALTSHLPHVVASALAQLPDAEQLAFAAGAFRDGTRVAASDELVWTGIFLDNRDEILAALDRLDDSLGAFRAGLERGDRAALLRWWREGRGARGVFAKASGGSDFSPSSGM